MAVKLFKIVITVNLFSQICSTNWTEKRENLSFSDFKHTNIGTLLITTCFMHINHVSENT